MKTKPKIQQTRIEWTDYTFNPWIGCTKVIVQNPATNGRAISPACVNCYAEAQDKFRGWTPQGWGKGKPRKRTSEANWNKPLALNEASKNGNFRVCTVCGLREVREWDLTLPPGGLACCSREGCVSLPESESEPTRPRIFCASLADVFDDEVPLEWLADLLYLIARTPHVDWQLLTKRPENWRPRVKAAMKGEIVARSYYINEWLAGKPLENVWMGTTVEDQRCADLRIPELLQIPAKIRFLSCEPMFEKLDLQKVCAPFCPQCRGSKRVINSEEGGIEMGCPCERLVGIHWIIAGGESGPNARPSSSAWFRSLRDEAKGAMIPFLFKQWGEYLPHDQRPDGRADLGCVRVGKKAAGRLLDGVEHNGFPQ